MNRLSVLVMVFLMSTAIGHSIQGIWNKEPKLEMSRKTEQSTLKCGIRPLKDSKSVDYNENRIVNGEDASYGEFPWQASLQAIVENGTQRCGASIISEFWLLTAAHCVSDAQIVRVIVGDHDLNNPDSFEQTFDVDNIIRHELYEQSEGDYDIALLRVTSGRNGQGIQFNNYVQPVCLPDSNTTIVEGTKCLISGWGVTKNPNYQGLLQKTEPTLISRSECQQHFKITERMLCAKDPSEHAIMCNGDSGGGLVYRSRGAFTLIGISSFVADGCLTYYPAVFADVSNLRPWIKSKLELSS